MVGRRQQTERSCSSETTDEIDSSDTVLDLTSYQLHDLDQIDLTTRITELDLTANRFSRLDPRIKLLSNLQKLSLRQNLIDDAALEPLSGWLALSNLQELILRDNRLRKIPDVGQFESLFVFDVSFNEITSMRELCNISSCLKELFVSQNNVSKIEGINHIHSLQILELGSNNIKVMENMENLKILRELWLGRNRIRVVNLCGLTCIKILSLQSNRLTSMKGFEDCVALEELYLSHNGIAEMEGLSSLVNLRVLDVSYNKLTSVKNIENLALLVELWLNDNQIDSLDGISSAVASSRDKLATIYLENNPCAKQLNYSFTLRQIFPNIQQIDSNVL